AMYLCRESARICGKSRRKNRYDRNSHMSHWIVSAGRGVGEGAGGDLREVEGVTSLPAGCQVTPAGGPTGAVGCRWHGMCAIVVRVVLSCRGPCLAMSRSQD